MSKTIKEKGLAERAINNFIGEKVHADNGVVHLVTDFNADFSPATPVTAATALFNPQFLRYAAYKMMTIKDRLRDASNIFNLGTIPTFTPSEYLHVVVHTEFAKAQEMYMQADTYHDQLVALPNYETVNFWQGTGESTYAFEDTSAINIKTASGSTVEQGGIVAVMFDRDAIMLCNENDRVTTAYNAKGEYTNNFYKFDISLFNDVNENGVVFVLD